MTTWSFSPCLCTICTSSAYPSQLYFIGPSFSTNPHQASTMTPSTPALFRAIKLAFMARGLFKFPPKETVSRGNMTNTGTLEPFLLCGVGSPWRTWFFLPSDTMAFSWQRCASCVEIFARILHGGLLGVKKIELEMSGVLRPLVSFGLMKEVEERNVKAICSGAVKWEKKWENGRRW